MQYQHSQLGISTLASMALQKLAYKRGEDRYKQKLEGAELDTWKLEQENKKIMNENGIRRNYLNRTYKELPIKPGDGIGVKLQKKMMNKAVPQQLANYSTVPYQNFFSDKLTAQINIGQVKSFGKVIGKSTDHMSPLDKRRLHGEVVRHEIDEATHMLPIINEKGRGNISSVFTEHPTLMNSHMDPRVIINESNRMITAPKNVKDFMTDIRRNGVQNSGWLASKMTRIVRPEEKNIKEVLPSFRYGETRINEADANAVSELYGTQRSARMAKVDNLLNKKIFGGTKSGPIKSVIKSVAKRMA